MEAKGSITIFFTLLLSIVISLVGTLLLSVKIAAGRVQIASAADLAMFSAMAKYDRELFEEYHLLYIDGSFGTGTLQLGKALDEIESDMSYLLTPNKEREEMGGKNLLQLERISGSIIGYTLATDNNGSVFYEQAVAYMEKTAGLQGISLLSQKLEGEYNLIENQENVIASIERQGGPEDYEQIKENVLEESKNNDLSEGGNGTEQAKEQEPDKEIQVQAEKAENIIQTVSAAKAGTLLQMVLPDTKEISGWAGEWKELYRNREIHSGMGNLERTRSEGDPLDAVLFQEYILQNLNHYGDIIHDTGPAYGVEWVLFEKTSDLENLEAAINRLMLIREAANAAALRADTYRYGQVKTMAEALAAVLKAPGIQYILEGIIILAWAFSESVVDVRGLMEGKSIPLVKSSDSWQVEFWDIVPAMQSPSQYLKQDKGLAYEDYLRTLLFMKSKDDKITGCMEVIEASVRELQGKEHFSMDCAIDTLKTEFQIRSERLVTFTISEKRSYRTM